MTDIRYVNDVETYIVRARGDSPGDTGSVRRLLGARLHVDVTDNVGGWVPADDMRDAHGNIRSGFVEASKISATQQLKIWKEVVQLTKKMDCVLSRRLK